MNDLYINIGSQKSCLFVRMSQLLIRKLEQRPLLYYSVEEALECAKLGYFGIGIITFAQLLSLFNKKTPKARHIVAHEILRKRPTGEMFESVVEDFKSAASQRYHREIAKANSTEEYQQKVVEDWNLLMRNLHSIWT